MQNGLDFEEVQFPQMMKQRQKHNTHKYGLNQLYFGLVNQVQLPHHTHHSQTNESQNFDNDDYDIDLVILQFSMPVVQKHRQISQISRSENITHTVGSKIRWSQFNENERIRHQNKDDMEDDRTAFGLYSHI